MVDGPMIDGFPRPNGSLGVRNHLLVLPSRAEGTPIALVEAMICARPAVVTDVGGNVEWLEDDPYRLGGRCCMVFFRCVVRERVEGDR